MLPGMAKNIQCDKLEWLKMLPGQLLMGSMDFFFDGLDEGRRDFFSVDAAADKIPEGLLLAQHFSIRGIGLDFFEHFSFQIGCELIVK